MLACSCAQKQLAVNFRLCAQRRMRARKGNAILYVFTGPGVSDGSSGSLFCIKTHGITSGTEARDTSKAAQFCGQPRETKLHRVRIDEKPVMLNVLAISGTKTKTQ